MCARFLPETLQTQCGVGAVKIHSQWSKGLDGQASIAKRKA